MALIDSLISSGGLSLSSLITYALISVVVTMVVSWIIKRQKIISTIEKIPGPKAIPILGNTLDLLVEPREPRVVFTIFVNDWCDYGVERGIMRIWLGPKPYIMIFKANPAEASVLLLKHFKGALIYDYISCFVFTCLLVAGSKWHSRRKTLTPAFHFKILEDFVEVFTQQADKLVSKLAPHADGKVINIFPFVTCATLDIICETAMGVSPNAQDDGDSDYVKSVYKINSILQKRQFRPWLHPDILFRLSEYGVEHEKCLKVLHGFTNMAIDQRKKLFKEKKLAEKTVEDDDIGKKKKLAFLDLLLDISDKGANLSDSDIREEVDTFMFEGHDTTSAAINWSLYLIGTHPDIQEKIQEELDVVFGGSNRPATMDDLRELKYLECCIKEALRLFPSVPLFGRHLKEDAVIEGYHIPAETTALIIPYRLHRDPEQFPEPEKFDPERFTPENSAKRHNYAYVPFSAGPRNCIGQKFAMMEEKIVISSILRNFEVTSTVKREDLIILGEIILRPEDGIFVSLKPRVIVDR
ncbi:unnamed protein product, partial [Meganyctiphanes norvegica]